MVNKSEHLTSSPGQTRGLARAQARQILKRKPKKAAQVLALEGELGAGKTTFLQGLARGLGITEKILSPTFIIMRNFKIREKSGGFENFYHIDCYRIMEPKEILDLGFKKIIANPKNIVAIEWAGRIKGVLPRSSITVKFSFIDKKTRKMIIKYL